jgi:hypothetical protein
MVEITYQMVLSTLQTVGILVGIAYYVMTLNYTRRNQQQQLETRQAQLFMPIHSVYQSEDHIKAVSEIQKWEWEDYDDYMAKYGEEVNPEAYMMYRKVFGFLEGLGVLVRRRLIDPSLVDDLMSGLVIRYWEKFEPIFVERRRQLNWPQVAEQIEYLYHQVKPIAERQLRELTTP